MARTQDEIIKRMNEADDLFSTQQNDLINFLTYDNARAFLSSEYIKNVEESKEPWVTTDVADLNKIILSYLPFAYKKARGGRGLSAGRSMLHMKSWIWLDDEEFYEEVKDLIDNYTEYGIPALDAISEHYGYKE